MSVRFYGVVFHALVLKLPIQTSHFVAPELPFPLSSGENVENSGKRADPYTRHCSIFVFSKMSDLALLTLGPFI